MAGEDTMTVKLLVGDVRDRIRAIPDDSIDLLACSPPFLALRKYGDNAAEMGSERTPADFLDALLELTGEFRRVLAPHGSIAIELGDTYSGAGGYGNPDSPNPAYGSARFVERYEGRTVKRFKRKDDGWPEAKSLTLIPTLYPASLAYGWNMLNPSHTFDRWRVRNIIVWARPNPPVGALGDKVRPATSYITIACTSARRFFDLDAVREPYKRVEAWRDGQTASYRASPDGYPKERTNTIDPAGAPPLDWWEDDDPTGHATLVLPTQPYPGAHYATWSPKLAARLIEMMCPLRVCTTCGEPSRRIVDIKRNGAADDSTRLAKAETYRMNAHNHAPEIGWEMTHTTLGWSDCGHDTWRPGRILDPFCGSSTTLAVAQGLGRDALGIELYEANAELSRARVGMFLEVL